ncbi:MAG: bifunctional DNA-binding transcriptional regulator/O6-methylguanine-DNA methyltransferase Ada [Ktedonobacteraceae bacterium]
MIAINEERYWEALQTKDRTFNGAFVYAVLSTGVYCKPSCPSRLPRREQVQFFQHAGAAEAAGFRPCKRCHPNTEDVPEVQIDLVRQACQYIETHLEEPLTLAALSEQVHLSPFHLQRVFKRVMGITPRQYVEACRLGQFKAQLRTGEAATVAEAMYEAGYSSSSRLYERTNEQLGMTPTTYRRGGKGMRISYTIDDSPLGRLLVAGTERGICSVCIGDDDAVLAATLRREYPAAEIEYNGAELCQWVGEILDYMQGQHPHLDLPLDIQATAFQWRVWQTLRNIPYGSTRSYEEIAQAVGNPKAARAVAQACATNPTALIIPCHRVVRKDGAPGGYRWGAERKRHLLEQEQQP